MWYKEALKFYFNKPLDKYLKVKEFADENLDDIEDVNENIENEEEIVEIEDPTPENDFTPEDLQENIQKIDNQPNEILKLPPLHENCRCKIETNTIILNDGSRYEKSIWSFADNCCELCKNTARVFNENETIKLMNFSVNVDFIS